MIRRAVCHPPGGMRRGRLWAAACCALAGWGMAAHAGTVQVDVLDAAGKPVADAVVFLDSAEARKLVRPLTGAEMAQEKRQFLPGLLVVPVGTEARTGLLCIAALAVLLLRYTRRRLMFIAGAGVLGLLALPFLPQSYYDRMATIAAPGGDELQASIHAARRQRLA